MSGRYISKALFISVFYIILQHVLLVMSKQSLEVLEEEELKTLFNEENYIITLFSDTAECAGKCKTLESTLLSVREEMVEDTGGWVVRSHAPLLAKNLGVSGSSIIFLRQGRPLLYTGPSTDEEVLLQYILRNKNPIGYNLTDSNFEKETQAGTGATTGDWLIMFTKSECPLCSRAVASFEAVGVNLKGRKNIALLEREHGPVTARRFGIKLFPTFLLFRLGKVYRYELSTIDVASLTAFAQDGFRNVKGVDVPPPKAPFDDITEAAADWLKENPGTALMSMGSVLLALLFIFLLNRPPPESWINKTKKKKK